MPPSGRYGKAVEAVSAFAAEKSQDPSRHIEFHEVEGRPLFDALRSRLAKEAHATQFDVPPARSEFTRIVRSLVAGMSPWSGPEYAQIFESLREFNMTSQSLTAISALHWRCAAISYSSRRRWSRRLVANKLVERHCGNSHCMCTFPNHKAKTLNLLTNGF